MTRQEHLLTHSAEECNEVAQRLIKALRFGLGEIYLHHPDGLTRTNAERIMAEFTDLIAVMDMAGFPLSVISDKAIDEKQAKVEKYLRYSKSLGLLTEG